MLVPVEAMDTHCNNNEAGRYALTKTEAGENISERGHGPPYSGGLRKPLQRGSDA